MEEAPNFHEPRNKNSDVWAKSFDPQDTKLLLQQKAMQAFEEYERKRANFSTFSSRKTSKPKELGLLADSDNFRSKQEARQLCDLGCSLEEKYGAYTGWKLGLRQDLASSASTPLLGIIDE